MLSPCTPVEPHTAPNERPGGARVARALSLMCLASSVALLIVAGISIVFRCDVIREQQWIEIRAGYVCVSRLPEDIWTNDLVQLGNSNRQRGITFERQRPHLAKILWPTRSGMAIIVPLGMPIAGTMIAAIALWRFSRRVVRHGCCANCGYSLIGNESGICPECGVECRPMMAEAKAPPPPP